MQFGKKNSLANAFEMSIMIVMKLIVSILEKTFKFIITPEKIRKIIIKICTTFVANIFDFSLIIH